jgi:hypothetical protein
MQCAPVFPRRLRRELTGYPLPQEDLHKGLALHVHAALLPDRTGCSPAACERLLVGKAAQLLVDRFHHGQVRRGAFLAWRQDRHDGCQQSACAGIEKLPRPLHFRICHVRRNHLVAEVAPPLREDLPGLVLRRHCGMFTSQPTTEVVTACALVFRAKAGPMNLMADPIQPGAPGTLPPGAPTPNPGTDLGSPTTPEYLTKAGFGDRP